MSASFGRGVRMALRDGRVLGGTSSEGNSAGVGGTQAYDDSPRDSPAMSSALQDLLDGFAARYPNLVGPIAGVPAAARALVVASIAGARPGPLLVLTASRAEADRLTDDLELFLPPPGALRAPDARHPRPYARLFPEIEMSLFDEGHSDPDRLQVLSDLQGGQPIVVVTPLLAFLQPVASAQRLRSRLLQVGDALDRSELSELLSKWGYSCVGEVEEPGQFCQQADIIDLYPSNGVPKRIELASDRIVSLRAFSVETQLSTESLDAFDFLPMREPQRDAHLLDSFGTEVPLIMIEPEAIRSRLDLMSSAADEGWKFSAYQEVELIHNEAREDWRELQELFGERTRIEISAESGEQNLGIGEAAQFEDFGGLVEMARARPNGRTLYVVTHHARRVRANLQRRDVPRVVVVEGVLSEGFSCPSLAEVISDRELFGVTVRPRYQSQETVSGLGSDFRQGDIVVHSERGIGRFLGLVPVDLEGARRDLFKMEYANDHTLMVPPEQIDRLTAYQGGEDAEPALSRLDTDAWQKVLSKTRESVLETAAAFHQQLQQRAQRKARSVGPDTSKQEELEAAFPFDETPSQLLAIEQIKSDLERETAMDRLLCGDVGYGKTEVALRAAFKAVAGGFQAALLAPTTILAQQHFEDFRLRMEPLGTRVAGLWGNSEDSAEVLAGLSDGSVQMVVGTHRLLSDDIAFSNLGLLVVDEEQQFGVGHKERLRQLADGVHVLSMTATPIPRTMQLALAGVRDISLLDAPPEARRPIRTYLLEEEDKFYAAALMRELEREGQVFVLHNSVDELPVLAKRLAKLVDGARVAVAHGQMEKGQLEKVLEEFHNHCYDVLVCSTIIEAGIDFPNVNSMIIKDAHMFGLAQLYQIRGRVGRASRQAYCYLMVPDLGALSEKARQRLHTVRRLTELGSGFRIASRDLEIRGAGDLLGSDQSGQIARVGYALYSRLLYQIFKGETETGDEQGCALEFPVDAHIPTEYIADSAARIGLYRRLSEMTSHAQIDRLKAELKDRFGVPPKPVLTLLEVTRLRLTAARLGVSSIRLEEQFGEMSVICQANERTWTFQDAPKGSRLLSFVTEALKSEAKQPSA